MWVNGLLIWVYAYFDSYEKKKILCRSLTNLKVVLKETSKMSLGFLKIFSGGVCHFVLRTLNMATLLSIRGRALDEKALDLLPHLYFSS